MLIESNGFAKYSSSNDSCISIWKIINKYRLDNTNTIVCISFNYVYSNINGIHMTKQLKNKVYGAFYKKKSCAKLLQWTRQDRDQ